MSDWCRSCGYNTTLKKVEEKDVHGHVTGYFEYTTCTYCDLTKVVTTWMEIPCPTPRPNSRR